MDTKLFPMVLCFLSSNIAKVIGGFVCTELSFVVEWLHETEMNLLHG